ncbi:MAG: hypothetical protein ACJ8H8_24950, partial [Geminicoccaceae bacterium]
MIGALPPATGAETALSRPQTVLWIVAGALMGLSLTASPGAFGFTELQDFPLPPVILAAAFIAVGAVGRTDLRRLGLMAALVALGCTATLTTVHRPGVAGAAGLGFWLQVLGLWLAAWLTVDGLARVDLLHPTRRRLLDLGVALAFGACVLFLWEVVTIGFGVPPVLMPSPSAIGAAFAASTPILWADFVQTFLHAVLIGWVLGCATGFVV